MNKSSFGNKLLLKIITTTIVIFAVTIYFISNYSYETSEKESKTYIKELSKKYIYKVDALLTKSLSASKTYSTRLQEAINQNQKINPEEMVSFMSAIVKDNKEAIGIWFDISKPGTLFEVKKDGQKPRYNSLGQFSPYITKTDSGVEEIETQPHNEEDEWVKIAKENKRTSLTSVYDETIDNKKVLITSITTPLYKNGEFIGSSGMDISLDSINEISSSVKTYNSGYAFILNDKGIVLGHPNSEYIGKDILDIVKQKEHYKKILESTQNNEDYSFYLKSINTNLESFYYSQVLNIQGTNSKWSMVLVTPHEEYLANAIFIRNFSIIAALIGLVLLALVIFFSVKSLKSNLKAISSGLENFFNFLNKETSLVNKINISSDDEFGLMAKNINDNVKSIQNSINQDNILIDNVKSIVNTVSSGKLDSRISSSSSTESLNDLKNLLNEMLNTLESTLGKDLNLISSTLDSYTKRDFTSKLSESDSGKIGKEIIKMNQMITSMLQDNLKGGNELQESSSQLSSNVSILSQNATSQAASLEQTAASIDEITSNIEQTSQKAMQMRTISSQTQDSSSLGKALANDTAKAMEEINEQVSSINEAISVIDQIAFQTNILSLNAAVEAATAGEAGKGFAVVAGEVRNLASRSAEAAREIKDLVENATLKANNGKEISVKMIDGFSSLEDKISLTNDLINDVSTAAQEQSQGMVQISSAINQLDKFTQENAVVAERAKDIANETNIIAINVVEDVNKNEFEGKSSLAKSSSKPSVSDKPILSSSSSSSFKNNSNSSNLKNSINSNSNFIDSSSNDEWESF